MLPTEGEWEHAAREHEADGDLADLAPRSASCGQMVAASGVRRLLRGDSSAYTAHPGSQPDPGVLEYNGKLMSGKVALRGGLP